jgi:hypothetical protein
MAVTMDFPKHRVTLIAFESEEDLVQTCWSLDQIFKKKTPYPRFYMIRDRLTTQDSIDQIKSWLQRMAELKADLETMKLNLDKKRFTELL